MGYRPEWQLIAVVELQDTLNRLVAGEYKTVGDLRNKLSESRGLWEGIADKTNVNVSGVSIPVDPS